MGGEQRSALAEEGEGGEKLEMGRNSKVFPLQQICVQKIQLQIKNVCVCVTSLDASLPPSLSLSLSPSPSPQK